MQAVGAARGMKDRRQHQNSVGVQHLSATCCAPTEHRVSTLHRSTPSCAYGLHGVIHIAHLRCVVSIPHACYNQDFLKEAKLEKENRNPKGVNVLIYFGKNF